MLLRRLVHQFSRRAGRSISIAIARGVPRDIVVDPVRLLQVITNALCVEGWWGRGRVFCSCV
jgi:hypothetical protein